MGLPMKYKTIPLHGKAIDISGQTFGRLTAIAPVDRTKCKHILWLCICECGAESVVRATYLRRGLTRSCGCLHREELAERLTLHGMSGSLEYRTWQDMRERCENPNDGKHKHYGGRGITVCDRWQTFEYFYADMGDKPAGLTIDRINNDGDYTPENCKWSTRKQQQRNKRNNRLLTMNEQTLCIAEWAEKTGLGYYAIYHRLERGWPIEKALTQPSMRTDQKRTTV